MALELVEILVVAAEIDLLGALVHQLVADSAWPCVVILLGEYSVEDRWLSLPMRQGKLYFQVLPSYSGQSNCT